MATTIPGQIITTGTATKQKKKEKISSVHNIQNTGDRNLSETNEKRPLETNKYNYSPLWKKTSTTKKCFIHTDFLITTVNQIRPRKHSRHKDTE